MADVVAYILSPMSLQFLGMVWGAMMLQEALKDRRHIWHSIKLSTACLLFCISIRAFIDWGIARAS